MIWCKSYIMERHRFDGADVAHLILAKGRTLDWKRLLARFGEHWRLLLAYVLLFGFIYPTERDVVPEWLLGELTKRFAAAAGPEFDGRECLGTLLSHAEFLPDVERMGFQDARLHPRGRMTQQEIDFWTREMK
jgi:hypothetical protein